MQKQAAIIKSSLISGNTSAASRALSRFSIAAEDARAHTGSFGWKVLGAVPFVGKDAKAITTVSNVAVGVAANAITPVIDEAQGDITKELAPRGGRIDLAAVADLQPTLRKVAGAMDQATQRIDDINTHGLFGFISKPLNKLRDEMDGARSGADAAYRASQLIPTMFGGSGTRRYLLLFDNNAEIRATGGNPGAWAVITANNGKIAMTRQGSANQITHFASPVLPQSAAEQAIYNTQIATYFQDVNFTPEFPRTADLAAAMLQKRTGVRVDGVMSVDAVSLSNFLKATGPVKVDGVMLTSSNAATELLNGVYTRFPNENAKQDAFFRAAAQTIFHKLMDSTPPTQLAKALAASVDQGRLYLHSFHASEQQILGDSAIAGTAGFAPSSSPQMGVYLNDATGSKMSYYLRSSVAASAPSCSAGRQTINTSVTLTMIKPTGPLNAYITGGGMFGTDVGQQTVLMEIYGPTDGSFSNWRFDGQATDSNIIVDRGRQVATIAVQLGAGAGDIHRIDWTTTSGPNQTGDTQLQVTPGMVNRPAVQQIASACH